MASDSKSCLVQKLSYYMEMDNESITHLHELEKDERIYPKGSVVYHDGDPNQELLVVKYGWLYSYLDLPDGRRQILKLHHPGDIIGITDIAFSEKISSLRATEEVCLCPFPKSGLDQILSRSAKLTALLFTLTARDQVILHDLILAMGKMKAQERLAYLLLDLMYKLKIIYPLMAKHLPMPLTQHEIGDYTGLTNIYVSRSFASLESKGYIKRSKGKIEILDEKGLTDLCGIVDRYELVDISWFPGNTAS